MSLRAYLSFSLSLSLSLYLSLSLDLSRPNRGEAEVSRDRLEEEGGGADVNSVSSSGGHKVSCVLFNF